MTTIAYPFAYDYASPIELEELSYLLMGPGGHTIGHHPGHPSVDPFQEDYFNASFDTDRHMDGYSSSDYSSAASSPLSTPHTTPPQTSNFVNPTEKKWTVDNGLQTYISTKIPTLPPHVDMYSARLTSSIYAPPFIPTFTETLPYHDQSRKRKMMEVPDLSINLKTKVVRSKVKNNNLQCAGINRKKNCQCKNAALMEYIGPKPIYCAEHIELDPNTLYEKCKSSYYKAPGDRKCCKEVVLKEFGMCHKHFHDLIADVISRRDITRGVEMANRLQQLYTQTEAEANSAKKKDSDLFQRKNKLLPKFAAMLKMTSEAVEAMRE